LFYSTFPIREQGQKGVWNFRLLPVYFIAILDFVYDEKEESLPNIGLIMMQDLETNENQWVNTGSAEVRKNYAKYFLDKTKTFQLTFAKAGAGVVSSRVGESYVKKLLVYFKSR